MPRVALPSLLLLLLSGCTSNQHGPVLVLDSKDGKKVRDACYAVGHVSFEEEFGLIGGSLVALENSLMTAEERRADALKYYLPHLQDDVARRGGDTLVLTVIRDDMLAGQAYVCAGYIDLAQGITK